MKPFVFTRIQYNSGDWDTDQRMPSNVLHSLVEYTTIPIDEKEKIIFLTDKNLFRSPFCYLSGHKLVEFTSAERANLKKYIENGGFLFVDDCNHDIDGLFAKSWQCGFLGIYIWRAGRYRLFKRRRGFIRRYASKTPRGGFVDCRRITTRATPNPRPC